MSVRRGAVPLAHDSFRVGEWLVEPSLNRLSLGDTRIQLELKVMDVLVFLAENAGEMVTRQEIIDRVWATEFIADNTLTKTITEIRNALGDDARNPSHIETIHRRGYRLIAPVDDIDIHDLRASVVEMPQFSNEREVARVERVPFPGLAVFSEAEAQFFFGRETETSQLWRKLTARRLLALIGPSGAGKSSLLRAGVIPAKPEGWSAVVCHPGEAPFAELARALVPEFANDEDALSRLIQARETGEMVAVVSRWRDRHEQVLLVVDQFEELFTLNTGETQGKFAHLLRRLADEADVHIVVALRDDFLCRCHAHEELRPIFSDLTVLEQPGEEALKRAIVEPAKRVGFTFIDTDIPKEMVGEVQNERGALPLLAFSLARLWEKRDRTRKFLTRTAYEDIGGVSGALARHAEATLTSIGEEHLPIVREIFRNLVSASGTRSVREVDELLSVFPQWKRDDARTVLLNLVDARLLTLFEDDAISGRSRSHRVEIVHESLLTSWPRLIRWRKQDVDAAGLHDEVRHAARRWDEHGRTEDYLWSGQMFREFVVWREGYPGGLTKLEDEFAAAMASLAAKQKRDFRLLCAAALIVSVLLATVFSLLWRRSAEDARRAEAQELLALGSSELETNPTAALAWARASLHVSDTSKGRRFALEALMRGPIARFLCLAPGPGVVHGMAFSPDGEWAAFGGWEKLRICRRSGGPALVADTFPARKWAAVWPFFDDSGDRLGAFQYGEIRTYGVPGFAENSRSRLDPPSWWAPVQTDRGVLVSSRVGDNERIELWHFDSPSENLKVIPPFLAGDFDAAGEWFFFVPVREDRKVYRQSLVNPELPARLVLTHGEPVSDVLLHPGLGWIALRGRESDRITVWSLQGDMETPLRSFEGPKLPLLAVDPDGYRIVAAGTLDNSATALVYDLRLAAGAEPIVLRSRLSGQTVSDITFDPSGRWVVAGLSNSVVFWPLPTVPGLVFPGDGDSINSLAFTPDGKSLVIPSGGSGGLRLQPLEDGPELKRLLSAQSSYDMALVPGGRFAVVSDRQTPVVSLYPLDGSSPTRLEGFERFAVVLPVAYDPQRELVAAAGFRGPPEQKVIRIWNLQDGSLQTLGPTEKAGDGLDGGYSKLDFLPDGSLLSSGDNGVERWRLETRSSRLLLPKSCRAECVAPDGSAAIVRCLDENGLSEASILDLETAAVQPLMGFQGPVSVAAYSPLGDIVAVGMEDGTVQLAALSRIEPQILYSHEAAVTALTFSPDGRRIASADQGGTVRVWNVPDLTNRPLQGLAHDELMAKLDAFTNLRVVRDEDSADGWIIETGSFPGWELVP